MMARKDLVSQALPALCIFALGGATLPTYAQQVPAPPAASAAPSATASPLARDNRLQVPVTVKPGTLTLAQVLPLLTKATHVNIYTEADWLNRTVFTLACPNRNAAALMDGLAAVYLMRWVRDNKKGYQLLDSAVMSAEYLPHTAASNNLHRNGMLFISGLDKLPEALRQAVTSGNKIPVSQLPDTMMQAVKGMAAASIEMHQEILPQSIPLDPNNLNGCSLAMQIQPGPQATVYNCRIEWEGTGQVGMSGFSFDDYLERKAEQDKLLSGPDSPLVPVGRFEQTQKQAKDLPELKQAVTLKLEKATLADALQKLHDTYGIAYIADLPPTATQTADLVYNSLPLGDVLDRLAQTYKGTEWEWRPLGFLVLRGPQNPARDAQTSGAK